MISDIIKKLQAKTDLTYQETYHTITEILSGDTDVTQNANFLSALSEKGETDDELLGMLDKMQELSLKIEPRDDRALVDMCGTGGDSLRTFNVSTTASFVVAAAGGIVAKHGNRSASGVSGSADIFEYLGYDLNLEPPQIARILEKHKICFMFAQKFHPAMRHVSQARREIGRRTAFNLLGPLSNPARVRNHLIGVFSTEYLDRLPSILKRRGGQNIMTVHSSDGMDEFSTSGINKVCILKDGEISHSTVDPVELGLHRSSLCDIQIDTRTDAVRSFVGVLNNTANQAMIETSALNAAGGLVVANIAESLKEGVNIALDTIRDGRAFDLLERFVADTGDISKLRSMI